MDSDNSNNNKCILTLQVYIYYRCGNDIEYVCVDISPELDQGKIRWLGLVDDLLYLVTVHVLMDNSINCDNINN